MGILERVQKLKKSAEGMLHKNHDDDQHEKHEKEIVEASAPADMDEDATAHKIVEIIINDIKELNNNFTNKLAEIEKSVKNSRENTEDLKKKVEKYDDRLDTIEKNIEKFIGLYEFVTSNLNPFIGEEAKKQEKTPVSQGTIANQHDTPQVIIEDSLSQESEAVAISPQKSVTKEEFTKQVSAAIGRQPRVQQPIEPSSSSGDLEKEKDSFVDSAEAPTDETSTSETSTPQKNASDTRGSTTHGVEMSAETVGEREKPALLETPSSASKKNTYGKEPSAEFLKQIEHDIEAEIKRELEEKKQELSNELHHELQEHAPKKLKDVARRLHFSPAIRPEKYFYLMNGQAAKSLDSLCNILRDISDSVFIHHVNHERNDFARWVEDVFEEYELAAQMREAAGRSEVVAILEHWLDEQYEAVHT